MPQSRARQLRHIYAAHLAIAIYRAVIADSFRADRHTDRVVDHVADALEYVKSSNSSETSRGSIS